MEVPLEPMIPLFVVGWSLLVILGLTALGLVLRAGYRWLKKGDNDA